MENVLDQWVFVKRLELIEAPIKVVGNSVASRARIAILDLIVGPAG
jgi:hypothetical protein